MLSSGDEKGLKARNGPAPSFLTKVLIAACVLAWFDNASAIRPATSSAPPAETRLAAELDTLRGALDTASFGIPDKDARRQAFDALLDRVESLAERYPRNADAQAWEGIVLSVYAGQVGHLGAMKYVKAARESLLEAERLGSGSLESSVYTALGALYAKVPGGLLGFGDGEVAIDYFSKALAADPINLDAGFFYGEFLIERGCYEEAIAVLHRALSAPPDLSRPLSDARRRQQIRALLETGQRNVGS
jgi:tetratricopeptide (TPR) repeat protein